MVGLRTPPSSTPVSVRWFTTLQPIREGPDLIKRPDTLRHGSLFPTRTETTVYLIYRVPEEWTPVGGKEEISTLE